MFVPYLNINGDSNVALYEIGPDYISAIFNGTDKIYTYSYESAGKNNVERMKALAISGNGLNSFINLYCRKLYVK